MSNWKTSEALDGTGAGNDRSAQKERELSLCPSDY